MSKDNLYSESLANIANFSFAAQVADVFDEMFERSALVNVLVPETIPTHRERLLQAGFSSCDAWFQCFNFISMLAVK